MRCRSGRTSCVARRVSGDRRRSSGPAGLQEETLCKVSYLQAVDGCPVYTEFFKEGDDVPGRLCRLHQGTIRQRVTRTVQGWVSELGRKLKGIFR